jgi:hypothetical protein
VFDSTILNHISLALGDIHVEICMWSFIDCFQPGKVLMQNYIVFNFLMVKGSSLFTI